MTPVGEGIANDRGLAAEPRAEAGPQWERAGQARERESRRMGLMLVAIGFALMSLAATDAVADRDAPGPAPADEAPEKRAG